MWLFRSGEDGLPDIVLYKYTEIRAKFNAVEFLKGFQGYLETDCYRGITISLALSGVAASHICADTL